MERELLKEANPAEWFNNLGQDQRYALAGGLIGGGALGGLNMLRGDRKNRFRNFLAGAAAGGLGGAALGFGASRMNTPAPADDAAEGAGAGVAGAVRPPPADVPPVPQTPRAVPTPTGPAPEAVAAARAADLGTSVGGKALLYGAGGAATGSALGAGTAGLRAGLAQHSANRAVTARNADLTRQISRATTPIVDSHLASRSFLENRLASLRQQQAQIAGNSHPAAAALRDYYARQTAAAKGRIPALAARMRADVAAAEAPLRAQMGTTSSAVRAGLTAAPGGAVARVPGVGGLARRMGAGWAGRAPAVGGILGLLGGTGLGVRDRLSATEGQ